PSIDRDGAKPGYELDLTRAVSTAVTVPVIASGGAGSIALIVEVARESAASAALAASIFHFGEASVEDAKRALAAAGIPARID
ncbi:MAG: HisA/HisF-related TIM barrel protein, partial [Amphiplicatus sp.]